jgi:hypothetical protein
MRKRLSRYSYYICIADSFGFAERERCGVDEHARDTRLETGSGSGLYILYGMYSTNVRMMTCPPEARDTHTMCYICTSNKFQIPDSLTEHIKIRILRLKNPYAIFSLLDVRS